MSTVAKEIFLLFADTHEPFRPGELESILGMPSPTLHTRATQEQLAQVLEEAPPDRLTAEDINRMATIASEERTEGRPLARFRR